MSSVSIEEICELLISLKFNYLQYYHNLVNDVTIYDWSKISHLTLYIYIFIYIYFMRKLLRKDRMWIYISRIIKWSYENSSIILIYNESRMIKVENLKYRIKIK